MSTSSSAKRSPQGFVKMRRIGFILVLLFGILGGVWLYGNVSELGWRGWWASITHTPDTTAQTVHLQAQAVYSVKKKQDLLGMQVVRIVSKQQPEEFLVVDGVSRALVDRVYGKPPDLAWANLMANQLIKLRESGEGDALPISVEIQHIKTNPERALSLNHQPVPYWQLEVQFKLSNEDAPRYYEAVVIRNARTALQKEPPLESSQATVEPAEAPAPSPNDTLIVGYAQKEAFQPELVADLMKHLAFEQN